MFVSRVFVLVFWMFFLKCRGLERISLEGDIILATETIIRHTTNDIFMELHLKNVKQNPKLKQTLLVHNYFTSISLKDHKTINEIVRISRIDKDINVNNETAHFTTLLNEILNEDSNEAEVDSNREDILQYVDEFLNNLQGLKERHVNSKYESLEIKDELLQILQSDNSDALHNVSQLSVTDKSDENLFNDNEFWVPAPKFRRIYRGERTKIKYFPFMASIQIFNSFQCAGSIIESDLIITAASCLQLAWNNRFFRENPAFLSVRVGSNFYSGGGESIPVLEVYFHPQYNPRQLKHNIAVLRLLRHLKFRKHKKRLKKINLDTYESALPMTTDGITIVGWGAKGSSNIIKDPWSNQLAYAVLDVYHLQECQVIYSKEYVTRTNFCAGFISKGGGACNHDVGGPGVVNGILTGVVSFGSPICGTPDAPTVFTKVGYYYDWIEEIMEQDVPHQKLRTTLRPETPPIFIPKELFETSRKPAILLPIPEDETTMSPTPLSQSDLRILDDEDLFKEFLNTLFTSNEVKQYQGLLNDIPVKKSKTLDLDPLDIPQKTQENYTESESLDSEDEETTTTSAHARTKMNIFETETQKTIRAYTIADENLLIVDDNNKDHGTLDDNIVKLIDTINISDTDKESAEKEVNRQATEAQAHNHKRSTKSPKVKDLQDQDDDSVFTLLYMSEGERGNASFDNIGTMIEDFHENFSDGMSIGLDGFKDMTFRNNDSATMLDFISEDELYKLISETVKNVTSNKSVKTFCFLT